MLNFYGVETLSLDHPLARTVAGGTHCMSNEYCREEEHDYERILSTPIDQLTA